MAIRIPFPVEEPPQVELTTYPVAELALSLHTVFAPGRSVEMTQFSRRMRARLPKPVAAELDTLGFLLGPPAPAPFSFPEGDAVPVGDALDAVTPKTEALQFSLAMHLELDNGCPRDPGVLEEIARDPEAIAGRFIQLLADYWRHAFEREWEVVEARAALARVDAELTVARGGIGQLLSATTKRARLTPDGIHVTPLFPRDMEVPLQDDRVLPVVLSLFSDPWVITRYWPAAGLVLPAPDGSRRVTPPSLELVQELDAIADATRLTMLRLVAEQPRSTRELSALLGLSEAGVSKHLHRLADAGLVVGERRGYYVLYRLLPERALAASTALLDFLRVATDSPAG
ncbi:MAG: metalloregulator ArsR/SmtB family transcription factor [Actinomycetota bacterium]